MVDWKQRKYLTGSPVRVILCDKNQTHTTGTLLTDYDADNAFESEHPRIRLKDGRIVHGYECWWIPEGEITKKDL